MATIVKHLVLAIFVHLRLLALWRYWNRRKITILALHGVTGQHSNASWSPLWERPTVERIASVLIELGRYYTPISFGDAVRILDGSAPAVDHGLVITFDDGYRNNFSEALPMLREMGIPATFFIATGYVETGRAYWVDRLDYALQQAPDDRRMLRNEDYEFDLRGRNRSELASGYRELRLSLKRNERDDAGMLRVVDEFAGSLESVGKGSIDDIIDTDPYVSVATWAEQDAACRGGATIGSHTVDHYRLTAIPKSAVDEQLVASKTEIEEKTGSKCEFFCYPNGSVDEYVHERVKSAGYRAAVTTVRGLNQAGDDLYGLKRFSLPLSEDVQKNLLRISGILESLIVSAVLGTR